MKSLTASITLTISMTIFVLLIVASFLYPLTMQMVKNGYTDFVQIYVSNVKLQNEFFDILDI